MVSLGASNILPVPLYVLDNYRTVTLKTDVVKINKVSFLVTTSRILRLATTAEMNPSRWVH